VEGEGEPVEGEGEPVEGEGEPVEGEGEPVEGEGEPVEGEGEPVEGEGEPVEGDEQVTVPDVTGMFLDDAIEVIEDAELRVGSVTLEFHDVVPKDYFISQSPAAGSRVTINAGVSLVQSKGPEYEDVSNGCGCSLFNNGDVKRFLGDFMLFGLVILTLAGMRRV